MRILFFLLTLILVAAVVVIGVYFISLLLKNFQPGKSKVQEDIRKMKAELQLLINDLVPWEKEELDLLSFNQTNQKIEKGFLKSGKGVVTSIYHEPMIVWSYKKYVGGGNNAVLFAATSHHEFIFRIRNNVTAIIIDGEEIGELRENGVLYSAQTDRLMARINRDNNKLTLPILVGEKELGTIKRSNYAQQTNNRAFELLSEMNDQEEAILLTFTILEMVSRTVEI